MQQFQRHIIYAEAEAACARAGHQFDASKYNESNGVDHLCIIGTFGDKHASILYAPWNGKFFGDTTDGIHFNSDNTEHDGQPWFDAMLNFFYVPHTQDQQLASAAPAPRPLDEAEQEVVRKGLVAAVEAVQVLHPDFDADTQPGVELLDALIRFTVACRDPAANGPAKPNRA
jgi:hypothetical protein